MDGERNSTSVLEAIESFTHTHRHTREQLRLNLWRRKWRWSPLSKGNKIENKTKNEEATPNNKKKKEKKQNKNKSWLIDRPTERDRAADWHAIRWYPRRSFVFVNETNLVGRDTHIHQATLLSSTLDIYIYMQCNNRWIKNIQHENVRKQKKQIPWHPLVCRRLSSCNKDLIVRHLLYIINTFYTSQWHLEQFLVFLFLLLVFFRFCCCQERAKHKWTVDLCNTIFVPFITSIEHQPPTHRHTTHTHTRTLDMHKVNAPRWK